MTFPRTATAATLAVAFLTACGDASGPGAPALASLDITSDSLAVDDGGRRTLIVVARDRSGRTLAPLPRGTVLAWSSADPAVARVEGNALVAVAPGRTVVRVAAHGARDSVAVRVRHAFGSLAFEGPAQGVVGQPLGQVVATLRDQRGAAIPGAVITLGTDVAGGTTSAPAVTTDDAGRAAFTWQLGSRAGTQRLTATVNLNGTPRSATHDVEAAPGAAVRVTLGPGDATLRVVGETAPLLARVEDAFGNARADAVAIVATSEERWLHDVPVLDPAALAQSRAVAAAPGTARLRATANGMQSAELVVRVAPTGSSVARLDATRPLAAGDTLVVRGYRLDAVAPASVTIDGTPAAVVGADSATLRVVLPVPATGAECMGSARAALRLGVASGAAEWRFARAREGEVDLPVGARLHLAGQRRQCLRLAPRPGAEYELAFMDMRPMNLARTGAEPAWGNAPLGETLFELWLADRGVAAAGATGGMASTSSPLAAPVTDVVLPSASAALRAGTPMRSVAERTTPWKAGDTATMLLWRTDVPSGRDMRQELVQVVEVVRERYVVMMPVSNLGIRDAGWLAGTRQSIARFDDMGRAMLRRALHDATPAGRTGQMLLVVGPDLQPSAFADETRMQLGLNAAGDVPASESAMFHEFAHLWQFLVFAELQDVTPTTWALEGGAEYLMSEIARALLQRPPTVEYSGGGFVWMTTQTGVQPWEQESTVLTTGRGYGSSAWMFHHMIRAAIRSGATYDQATYAMARGSLEGWYGRSVRPNGAPGVQGRLAPWLGTSWEPKRLLLEAIGDRIGWSVSSGVLPAAQGRTIARRALPSSAGFFRLTGDEHGGAYLAEAAVDGVEWMLVRVK